MIRKFITWLIAPSVEQIIAAQKPTTDSHPVYETEIQKSLLKTLNLANPLPLPDAADIPIASNITVDVSSHVLREKLIKRFNDADAFDSELSKKALEDI